MTKKPLDTDSRLQQMAAASHAEMLKDLHETMDKKKIVERMLPYFTELAKLTDLEEPLSHGESLKDDVATFLGLLDHAENLWSDAASLFHSGRFAPSLFLSIVATEEIGKIAVAEIQVYAREMSRKSGKPMATRRLKRKRNPIYSHPSKHLLASYAGAIVNSRLDQVLGIDRVNQFISTVENGKLERLRQDCLYYDLKNGIPHFPYKTITATKAGFYLIVAGELLAQVGLLGTPRYHDFLKRVERIEKHLGYIAK